jgi:hypothetical protein
LEEKRNTRDITGAITRSQEMKMVGTHPPTPTHNTQPPLTHTPTRSNFDATTTITASINTAVIAIQFLPTITFAVVPSPVATYVVATYEKKDEKGG